MADKKFPTDYTDEITIPDNDDKFMITDNSSGEALKRIKWGSIVTNIPTITNNNNDIINAMMDIWQRNTTFTSINNGDYSADRFQYYKGGSMVHDILRSTDTPSTNFNYSLHVDCTTADTSIATGEFTTISQKIEGYNFKKYIDNYGTLGFWVKSAKTGIHCVSFINSGADRSYVAEYTVNATNTWEYKTITVLFDETGGTWDYINGIGITIRWALAAGTTFQTTKDTWQTGNYYATSNQVNVCDNAANDFKLTGITFNLGSSAIDFNYYDYEKEIARCQRYYEKNYNLSVVPGTATGTATGYVLYVGSSVADTINFPSISFKVRKRLNSVTVTTYSSYVGTASVSTNHQTSADFAANSATVVKTTETEFIARNGSGGVLSPTYNILSFNWTAETEL
jgi:hypothetical protein